MFVCSNMYIAAYISDEYDLIFYIIFQENAIKN